MIKSQSTDWRTFFQFFFCVLLLILVSERIQLGILPAQVVRYLVPWIVRKKRTMQVWNELRFLLVVTSTSCVDTLVIYLPR
jgi:hypothetical protein